jgi:hypothetical protein
VCGVRPDKCIVESSVLSKMRTKLKAQHLFHNKNDQKYKNCQNFKTAYWRLRLSGLTPLIYSFVILIILKAYITIKTCI